MLCSKNVARACLQTRKHLNVAVIEFQSRAITAYISVINVVYWYCLLVPRLVLVWLAYCCIVSVMKVMITSVLFCSKKAISFDACVWMLKYLDNSYVPSVLWRCWLGGRKGIRPVKNWVVGCWHGYLSGVMCISAYGPADATATQCLLLE